MYAVIAENDISEWEDRTGEVYHFPSRYLKYLHQGTQVIYYKGKLQDRAFRQSRLTDEPHYFGAATIGRIYRDPRSAKGDHFAEIEDFQLFLRPVPLRIGGEYIEVIPESRSSNYWRDGVRPAHETTYRRLYALGAQGGTKRKESTAPRTNDAEQGLESYVEGNKKLVYSTTYERNSQLRHLAIAIHGLACKACGFNFEQRYGSHGRGFIHVHHLKPLADAAGPLEVNPATDLTVLCANCHAMVHRRRDQTLSVDELQRILHR